MTHVQVAELIESLISSNGERKLQAYLSSHLWILLNMLALPWQPSAAMSQFKLGNQFATDFLVISGASTSYQITLVELEPPDSPLFNKDGTPARRLNQALKQVAEWNAWLTKNPEFFKQEVARALHTQVKAYDDKVQGLLRPVLGLIDGLAPELRILPEYRSYRPPEVHVQFLIVIGRRATLSQEDQERRASMIRMSNPGLDIATCDRLLDVVRGSQSYLEMKSYFDMVIGHDVPDNLVCEENLCHLADIRRRI